jgi:hypothetical protein
MATKQDAYLGRYESQITEVKKMVTVTVSKKLCAVMILVVLLIAFCAQLNVAYAEKTEFDTGEVVTFLRDVIHLDMTKYEARLATKATNYWPMLDGIAQTTGQYELDSSSLGGTSILTVNFAFWDSELLSCSFYENSRGPTQYSKQPAADLKNAVSDLLERYQTYTGDTQIAQMRSLLDAAQVASNDTKSVGNLALTVYVEEDDHTLFTWGNIVNGVDYSRLRLVFRDGAFSEFADDRGFYTLGSSEANVPKEEAINIALEYAKTYSYMSGDKEITNFGIVEGQIRSEAAVLNRTKRMELYPCWIVDLPLDKIYPGGVAIIKVMVWADTGEVISCEALGYGFPYNYPDATPSEDSSPLSSENNQTDNNTATPPDATPSEDSSPLSSENNQTDNNTATPPAEYIITASVAIAITVTVASVLLFKKKRREKIVLQPLIEMSPLLPSYQFPF